MKIQQNQKKSVKGGYFWNKLIDKTTGPLNSMLAMLPMSKQ